MTTKQPINSKWIRPIETYSIWMQFKLPMLYFIIAGGRRFNGLCRHPSHGLGDWGFILGTRKRIQRRSVGQMLRERTWANHLSGRRE